VNNQIKKLFLEILDLLTELSISFAYNEIEGIDVPTLHADSF